MSLQKPIVDFFGPRVSHNPSKNYLYLLLAQQVKTLDPLRTLDAGTGTLRNVPLFPNRYVGITYSRPDYIAGLALPENAARLRGAKPPEVYLMRLESDFSFLGAFDLCVCTNTITYVANQLDCVRRLSARVQRGGSFLINNDIAHVEQYYELLRDQYERVEIIYYGFRDSYAGDAAMIDTRAPSTSQFLALCQQEMDAPNIKDGHAHFYLCAHNKLSDVGRLGRPLTSSSTTLFGL